VLQPSSPLLASDRGRLTGPHPIIKIGQEPLWLLANFDDRGRA
jgi:hypothetical protein